MNTKPSLGIGFAGVWAHAVEAGTIASSRGRARAACALFRNVRLGIAFFVRNITLSLSTYWLFYRLQTLPSFQRAAFETERSSRFREGATRTGIRLSRRLLQSCDDSSRTRRCCDVQPGARASEDWRPSCSRRAPARSEGEEEAARLKCCATPILREVLAMSGSHTT